MRMYRHILLVVVLTLSTAYGQEQGQTMPEVIYLPDIEVSGTRETGDTITKEELDRDGAKDLWEAMRYVPGVIISGGGARNDSGFTVRGFDSGSVPVYLDGISQSNPFRGDSGDSARMLTGDLEVITVQKSYSSMLYGADAFGGAVLMKLAKPKREFEASVTTSFEFDSIWKYAANTTSADIGAKGELLYGKAVVQHRDVNHFRMSNDFVQDNASIPQRSRQRDHSDSKDTKYTFIGGVTPSDDLDMWAVYTFQDAGKGLSPLVVDKDYSANEWTEWEKHSFSLNGEYAIGDFNFKALAYYDKYDNTMNTYNTLQHYELGVPSLVSVYDEYIVGGGVSLAVGISTARIKLI